MKRILSLILALVLLASPASLAYMEIMPISLPTQLPVIALEGGSPSGVALAEDGSVWFTDTWGKAIWRWDGVSLEKVCGVTGETDLLGKAEGGYKDGAYAVASFEEPFAIVAYQGGFAVSDTGNNAVRLLKDGKVSTLLEVAAPTGLACDEDGNLYISGEGNVIWKADAKGALTTYLSKDLSQPMGLCWYDGALYIADAGSHRVLMARDGAVTTVAGGVRDPKDQNELEGGAYRNGSVAYAGFASPQGVLVCEEGIYVTDSGNGALRLIRDGYVTTVRSASDLYPASPRGMALSDGLLWVCDLYAGAVFSVAAQPALSGFADMAENTTDDETLTLMRRFSTFKGDSDGRFLPDETITRAEFFTALSKLNAALYPYEIITGDAVFGDVPEDAYYADAVAWGRDNSIAAGIGGGLFGPERMVTREEAAVFLYKYAVFDGLTAKPAGSAPAGTSSWAQDAVSWAVSADIWADDGAPSDALTRLEAARMLAAYLTWMR